MTSFKMNNCIFIPEWGIVSTIPLKALRTSTLLT